MCKSGVRCRIRSGLERKKKERKQMRKYRLSEKREAKNRVGRWNLKGDKKKRRKNVGREGGR